MERIPKVLRDSLIKSKKKKRDKRDGKGVKEWKKNGRRSLKMVHTPSSLGYEEEDKDDEGRYFRACSQRTS